MSFKISAPINACLLMIAYSSSDSLVGLFTMESGIPIIPTSCIYAALRRLLTLASSHPSSLAIKAE